MRALKCDAAKGELSLEDVQVPEVINPDDIIIKVGYAGLCGTDLHIIQVGLSRKWLNMTFWSPKTKCLCYYQGEFAVCSSSKVTLGHEFAGTIVSVGQGVTR